MSNWAVPEFPRNQVDKAGFTLVDRNATEEDQQWALRVINNWRSSHSYPLLNFRMNLRQKLRSIQTDAIVAQRIKRLDSIRAKLDTRSSMQLSQMQDIGGCRAVVKSLPELSRLVDSYARSGFAHVQKGAKDYIEQPKPDGYRSKHIVYQYKCRPPQKVSYDKLRIEIQIRTNLQHAWATAVEAVGIFTRQALKSNIGSKDWLRLFALMSSEIALIEGTPLIPGTPENDSDRLSEIKEIAGRLRAVYTLNSYRATINWATQVQITNTKYYLLEYDYDANTVVYHHFPGNASQRANMMYTRAEVAAQGANKNVVLVSVDSLQALRRAYPNYFLDTEQFAKLLSAVLKR